MSGVGNEEQVRIISEQLFATWETKQARKEKEARRWWQSNAGGWVAILIVAVSAIVTASNINTIATDANARSIKNESAINDMRAQNADRLARMETKIDRLLEDEGK
jgi:NADH:ubiquinone oxidoreductase subunit 6 (subunit J)